jgi:hypothetical protein
VRVSAYFGLPQGLGFMAALAATGLPRGSMVSLRAAFNLGVEKGGGKSAVVLPLLGVATRLRRASAMKPLIRTSALSVAAAYAMGFLAGLWLLARVGLFTGTGQILIPPL